MFYHLSLTLEQIFLLESYHLQLLQRLLLTVLHLLLDQRENGRNQGMIHELSLAPGCFCLLQLVKTICL